MKKIYYSICFLLLLAGCNSKADTPETTTDQTAPVAENILILTNEQLRNLDIATTVISKQDASREIILNGYIDVAPQNQISVTTAIGGYVKDIRWLPGDIVRKGQILVTLQDPQYILLQQDYLTVKTQITEAQSDYERQQALSSARAVSEKSLEVAKSQLQSLEIRKRALEEQLKLIHITPGTLTASNMRSEIQIAAPADGQITQIFANKGKRIGEADVIMEIVQPDSYLIRLRAFEKDFPSVVAGQTIIAYCNQYPDKKIEGKILSIGRQIDASGAGEIFSSISKSDVKLVNGLFVSAKVAIQTHPEVLLPDNAVVNFEGKNYVFIQLKNNEFELYPVQITETYRDKVALKEIEQLHSRKIVTEGSYGLLMAMKNSAEGE